MTLIPGTRLGIFEIYIRPFAAAAALGAGASPAAGQWQVSTAGGIYPRWRSDGRELYYIGPSGQMMAAPVAATATTIDDVTRDGRFIVNTVLDDASSPITLIQNWTPGETP